MPSLLKVAVVGGTGLLGNVVVQELERRSDLFDLTVVTRNTSTSSTAKTAAKVVKVDSYTDNDGDELVTKLGGYDALISMLPGRFAPSMDPLLLQAAIRANVKLFIASEYTFDIEHPAAQPLAQGIIKARIDCVKQLRKICEKSQTRCMSISVGAFLDDGFANGLLGFDIVAQKATLYDGGVHKATGSTLPFIGRAVAEALQLPVEGPQYRRLRVAEVEYSGKEVLKLLEELTGKSWQTADVSSEELKQRGKAALEAGDMRANYVNAILQLNYSGCGAVYFEDGLAFRRETLKRQSLRSIVEQAVQRVNEKK